jgi:SAM-dependent methyltransferase
MKKSLLEHLRCPRCEGESLSLREQDVDAAGEIVAGEILCAACSQRYPIRAGIPRMLPAAIAPEKGRIAKAFGEEWLHYSEMREGNEDELATYLAPLGFEVFRDKLVLDAGCGTGKFAYLAAKHGAREVLAVDLSDAVEVAYRNTRGCPNVHVIQADIYHLPVKPRIDVAYSIGVLMLIPDPQEGFRSVARSVRPGGLVLAWVYGKEGNRLYELFVEPVRRHVTAHLPAPVNRLIAKVCAAILWIPTQLVYVPLARSEAGRRIGSHLPYFEYLLYFHRLGWYFLENTILDKIIAPVCFLYSREEFAAWFDGKFFSDVGIFARTGNSWRGHATLSAPLPGAGGGAGGPAPAA